MMQILRTGTSYASEYSKRKTVKVVDFVMEELFCIISNESPTNIRKPNVQTGIIIQFSITERGRACNVFTHVIKGNKYLPSAN